MDSRWSRVKNAVATAALLVTGSAAGDAQPTRLPPDFSATAGERFSHLGISASALAQVLELGDLVWVDYTPRSKKVPWLTTSATLVGAPADRVYEVVRKVADYPSFMAQAREVTATPVSEGVDEVQLAFALNAGVTEIINRYGLYYHYQPPGRVDWALAWGEFQTNVGLFEVIPVPGDPGRSLLLHTSCALPRAKVITTVFSRVPGLDIKVNLTAGLVLMKAIKARAESLQGGARPIRLGANPSGLGQVSATLATLARGSEVVLVEHTTPRFFTGVTVLPAGREKVFGVLADWDKVAPTIPAWDASTVSRSSEGAVVDIKAHVPFVIDIDSEYRLDVSHRSPEAISWSAQPGGDLEGVRGSWEFLSLGEAQTLLLYRNTYNLASHGYLVRNVLSTEPLFEDAIHVSETQQTVQAVRRMPGWRAAAPTSGSSP